MDVENWEDIWNYNPLHLKSSTQRTLTDYCPRRQPYSQDIQSAFWFSASKYLFGQALGDPVDHKPHKTFKLTLYIFFILIVY